MSRRAALLSIAKQSTIYTNFVSNGNFTSITGWLPLNCTRAISSNTLLATGNGTAAQFQVYQATAQTRHAQKVYARAKLKSTSADCTKLELLVGATIPWSVDNPTVNTVYDASGVMTMPSDNAGLNVNIRATYASAAAANGKLIEVQEVLAVDLTATFGTGNEPTKAWCDTNLPFVVSSGIL